MLDNRPPFERVVVFDEAQRCWDQRKLSNWMFKKTKTKIQVSEPHYLIETMDRHKDWAVIVCLVGLGQDIYNGEVGINEWFRSAIKDFSNWDLYYSPTIFNQLEDKQIDRSLIESSPRAHQIKELHLGTDIRSFRSDKQASFVDSVLEIQPEFAKTLCTEMAPKYPIFITRNLEKAKKWIRNQVRGSERSGIVACSSAQRLKPEGIYVPTDIDVKNWFLAPKADLRSSNALEVVASEFKIQGLEIDWSIVCWDADLRISSGEWQYYSFKGTKWMRRGTELQRRYLLNAYRVLLTRARQGMVIFVPVGVDPSVDVTRNHDFYDPIYEYLHFSCGIPELL